ncbi:MAG: hypothetical protein HOP28_12345 [Gemmatimonadales bacterium]|nr:hypothetical protein [Gemmatimonadales bacterium]
MSCPARQLILKMRDPRFDGRGMAALAEKDEHRLFDLGVGAPGWAACPVGPGTADWAMRTARHSGVFLLWLTAACGSKTPAVPGSGPTVARLDSLPLAAPDSLESFLPLRTHVVSANGEVFLETGTALLHFDPRGRLMGAMGRPGRGPGEFVRISTIVLLPGDSLIGAVDARRGRIVIFGAVDHQLRREAPMNPVFFPGSQWVLAGNRVVFGTKLSPEPFTSWFPDTDSLRRWGAAPPIFSRSLTAYSQGGEPSLAPYEDGWIALFPGDGALHRVGQDGAPLGIVPMPVRRRLGVPADLAEQVAAISASGRFRYAASLALGLHRLADGRYLVIHLDADAEVKSDAADGAASVIYSNVRYWASLVSADLARACVDSPVPFETDNILPPYFHGDILTFLSRDLDGSGRLRTVLHSYRVGDAGCDWVATGGVRAPPGLAAGR